MPRAKQDELEVSNKKPGPKPKKTDGRKTWRLNKVPKELTRQANIRAAMLLLEMAKELLAKETSQ